MLLFLFVLCTAIEASVRESECVTQSLLDQNFMIRAVNAEATPKGAVTEATDKDDPRISSSRIKNRTNSK